MDSSNNLLNLKNVISGGETVYGGTNNDSEADESRVMSEKVQMLASSIYKELEAMIQKNGEDSVKNFMPLVVSILESLESAYAEKEEHAVEIEMIREDNEQLLTQYEREKSRRKEQDQKFFEAEEHYTDMIKDFEGKIESFESVVRMLELKSRNAQDHSQRMEEREAEQKMEYERLHERYNELIRTHIEHVERTKYLMGSDKFDMMQSLPFNGTRGRNNAMTISMDTTKARGITDIISAVNMSQSTHADMNLAEHISSERDWQEEFGLDAGEFVSTPRDNQADTKSVKSVEEGTEEAAEKETYEETRSNDSLPVRIEPKESEDVLTADLTGMGKEVENLIKENTELLETKNALNIVKNDLIARVDELGSEQSILREEIQSLEVSRYRLMEKNKELEAEVKEVKEKLNKVSEDEQENIPMGQRKRFTRAELARVILEKNGYKEKYMELQDSMKFLDAQRLKKQHAAQAAAQAQNGKRTLWDFFSGLFQPDEMTPTTARGYYNQKRGGHRRSVGDVSEGSSRKRNVSRPPDYDPDHLQEKRMLERKEQYRKVSKHIKKEDISRTAAYGWSIPTVAVDDPATAETIPVPVCCRPLMDQHPSLKIWCAAGVTLRGGKTKDGGYIVEGPPDSLEPVDMIDYELKTQQRETKENEMLTWESSSLVWVCSSNEKKSLVSVLDANNPNNILETFNVCSSHILCVATVPGVRESDYPSDEATVSTMFVKPGGFVKDLPMDLADCKQFGEVEWVPLSKVENEEVPTYIRQQETASPRRIRDFSLNDTGNTSGLSETPNEDEGTIEETGFEKRSEEALAQLPSHIRDGLSKYEGIGSISTALPSMWMGSENDYIFVHSGVSEWRKCLLKIKMADAVLSIIHYKGRIFAAMANGTIAVFHRSPDGLWAVDGYHKLSLGKGTSSVTALTIVTGRVWAAYRNCVVIIDPKDLTVEKVFVAHPRRDSQVRAMQWLGDGVWISIRLDSTIRLFHAHTHQHLQDVDIEPYITKMLGTNKLDFLHLRITSLVITNRRLWIGTGTGVILSVPLNEDPNNKNPEIYADPNTERVAVSSFIPYCDMELAQLSFHGHKDSIRFFLPIPAGSAKPKRVLDTDVRKLLVVSGGDGYIDFRLGEEDDLNGNLESGTAHIVRPRDMSHIIVWEMNCTSPNAGGDGLHGEN